MGNIIEVLELQYRCYRTSQKYYAYYRNLIGFQSHVSKRIVASVGRFESAQLTLSKNVMVAFLDAVVF